MNRISYKKLLEKYSDLRMLWGNINTTFHELEMAWIDFYASAISCSDERTDMLIDIVSFEYNLRAPHFLVKSPIQPEKLTATISRFPQGSHYYVTIRGEGVDFSEKRNTPQDAERLMMRKIKNFRKSGFSVDIKGYVI